MQYLKTAEPQTTTQQATTQQNHKTSQPGGKPKARKQVKRLTQAQINHIILSQRSDKKLDRETNHRQMRR